jgi:GLPGLI family protein
MKKSLLFFLFLLGGLVTMQAQLKSGYIKMEITEVGSDNEQMAMQLEMMKGTQTEIFFNENMNLSKMSMMGGMMETTTLYNAEAAKTDMLMNMMGQKIHIETTDMDVKALNQAQGDMMKDMKITKDESDKKTILGYECTKTTFTNTAMQGMDIIMYLTNEIEGSVKGMQMIGQLEFDGFPLQIIINNPQISMTVEAIELKKEVDPSVFNINTGGYKKMSMEEFQKQMGAMGAGMGF